MEVGAGGPFANLARDSGFSVRDCQVAAATGRLPQIIRIAEQRKRGTSGRTMSGWEALRNLDRRRFDPRWLLLELRLREAAW